MTIKYRTQLGELMKHFGLSGGDVAELGVAEGRFSAEIIKWDIGTFYMIDAWKTLNQKGDGGFPQEWHDNNNKEALERTDSYRHKRMVLRGLTQEMIPIIPDNSLSLVYIDADHSYRGALMDLETIYSKVKVGGIISGHDFLNPAYGVKQAVADFTRDRFEVNLIEEDHPDMAGFWFIKK